jgi:hypothetical protein
MTIRSSWHGLVRRNERVGINMTLATVQYDKISMYSTCTLKPCSMLVDDALTAAQKKPIG